MPRYKLVNGERVQFTAQEEADRDAEELAWSNGAKDRAIADLRAQRDAKLKSSDWKVIMAKEKGTTLTTAWKNWRQSLRDLPSTIADDDTADDVRAMTLPTEPS